MTGCDPHEVLLCTKKGRKVEAAMQDKAEQARDQPMKRTQPTQKSGVPTRQWAGLAGTALAGSPKRCGSSCSWSST